jgi:hypothetical protein
MHLQSSACGPAAEEAGPQVGTISVVSDVRLTKKVELDRLANVSAYSTFIRARQATVIVRMPCFQA